MDRFESEPYESQAESGDDWRDQDEDCTCRFAGDMADNSECYAHGTFAAIREEAAVLLAPVLPVLAAMHCPFCDSTRLEKLGPFTACVNCKQIWNPASGRMVA